MERNIIWKRLSSFDMLLAALALGFISSLHCVGMCGPLAMLIHGQNKRQMLINRLTYNMGRIVTYGLLGAVVGLLGHGIQMGNFQNVLSIVIGSVVIVFLVFPSLQYYFSPAISSSVFNLKSAIAHQISRPKLASAFITGIFNGMLPCGMVYMALALAVLQGGVMSSILFMVSFGIATVPAMILTVYAAHSIKNFLPVSVKKIQTAFLILLAVVMIGRGVLHQNTHAQATDEHGITICP